MCSLQQHKGILWRGPGSKNVFWSCNGSNDYFLHVPVWSGHVGDSPCTDGRAFQFGMRDLFMKPTFPLLPCVSFIRDGVQWFPLGSSLLILSSASHGRLVLFKKRFFRFPRSMLYRCSRCKIYELALKWALLLSS